MKKRSDKITLTFSRGELVHIRRLLNRAVDCAHGECPKQEIQAWYCIRTPLQKIVNAIREEVPQEVQDAIKKYIELNKQSHKHLSASETQDLYSESESIIAGYVIRSLHPHSPP